MTVAFSPEDFAMIQRYAEATGAVSHEAAILNAVSIAVDDMDKPDSRWADLKDTIQELHASNMDKPEVELVTRFLLNLMNVMEQKHGQV